MPLQTKIIHFTKKIVHCDECGSKKLCLTNILSQLDKELFQSLISSVHSYSKGQPLFHSGETLENLYVLKTGSAKSYLIDENGDQQNIGFHFPGELLGLDDIFNLPHTSTLAFLEDAKVCLIPKTVFVALIDKTPQLTHEIITRLNSEIQHAHQLQFLTNHSTAKQRVAAFILELSERMNLIGFSKASFKLPMTRADIANYLGLASDTVSRILKTFERGGSIQVNNKNLDIISSQQLNNYANTCDKCPSVVLNRNN